MKHVTTTYETCRNAPETGKALFILCQLQLRFVLHLIAFILLCLLALSTIRSEVKNFSQFFASIGRRINANRISQKTLSQQTTIFTVIAIR